MATLEPHIFLPVKQCGRKFRLWSWPSLEIQTNLFRNLHCIFIRNLYNSPICSKTTVELQLCALIRYNDFSSGAHIISRPTEECLSFSSLFGSFWTKQLCWACHESALVAFYFPFLALVNNWSGIAHLDRIFLKPIHFSHNRFYIFYFIIIKLVTLIALSL